jgi:hypothetical protein
MSGLVGLLGSMYDWSLDKVAESLDAAFEQCRDRLGIDRGVVCDKKSLVSVTLNSELARYKGHAQYHREQIEYWSKEAEKAIGLIEKYK